MDTFPTETLEKYKIELENDLRIDELNVKDVQMKLPSIKHKWVARLIQAKTDFKKLERMKALATEKALKNLNTPVELSKLNQANAASKNEVVQKISNQMIQQELIIDYLTRVEHITRNMTYDIGNLAKIMQLELT